MKSGDFKFFTEDKTEIFTYKWLPDDNTKIRGAVQIVGDNQFAKNFLTAKYISIIINS